MAGDRKVYGGAGFGYLELCMIAAELGRSLATTPFSSSVYLATEALLLAGSDAQKRRYLPRLAQGEAIGCLALGEGPRAPLPRNIETHAKGDPITGVKLPVPDGDIADFAVVAARTSDGGGEDTLSPFVVDLAGHGVERERVATVDPTRSHARIRFHQVSAKPLGPIGGGWALLRQLFDRAAVLFAFEQVGGAQAALEMARDYALGRFAFGRPIGSFQAIKHKLAEIYVAIELARSNAYYGAPGRCRRRHPSCASRRRPPG